MTSRLITILLLAIHAALLVWALLGLIEPWLAQPPWPTLANPLFPGWLQLAQWLTVLVTGLVFPAGYAVRWSMLPWAMVAGYGAMATVCAVQTLCWLRHDGRFLDMAIEYAAYILILVWLFRAPAMRRRFHPGHGNTAGLR
jgi:hypothetical protein